MANPPQRTTGIPRDWRVWERYLQSQNRGIQSLALIPGERILLPGADLKSATGPTLQVWQTANLALGTPFDVYGDRVLAAIHYATGDAGGTFDVGVYRPDGTRVISAGAATKNVNTAYRIALSAPLPAGRYYAVASSSGTAIKVYQDTRAVGNTWPPFEMMGVISATGSYPLPATLTFESPVSAGVFCCSIEFA